MAVRHYITVILLQATASVLYSLITTPLFEDAIPDLPPMFVAYWLNATIGAAFGFVFIILVGAIFDNSTALEHATRQIWTFYLGIVCALFICYGMGNLARMVFGFHTNLVLLGFEVWVILGLICFGSAIRNAFERALLRTSIQQMENDVRMV